MGDGNIGQVVNGSTHIYGGQNFNFGDAGMVHLPLEEIERRLKAVSKGIRKLDARIAFAQLLCWLPVLVLLYMFRAKIFPSDHSPGIESLVLEIVCAAAGFVLYKFHAAGVLRAWGHTRKVLENSQAQMYAELWTRDKYGRSMFRGWVDAP